MKTNTEIGWLYSRASSPQRCGFVTEPPSSPLSLAVEEVSQNSVTLTWKTPEQTGRSGLDGYVVEICKDGSRLVLSCLISTESLCVSAEVWDRAGQNPAAHFPEHHFLFFCLKDFI